MITALYTLIEFIFITAFLHFSCFTEKEENSEYVKLMLLPYRHKVLNSGNINAEPTILPSVWETFSTGHMTLHKVYDLIINKV